MNMVGGGVGAGLSVGWRKVFCIEKKRRMTHFSNGNRIDE